MWVNALVRREGATVTSDQELFAKGLATYQRVMTANYIPASLATSASTFPSDHKAVFASFRRGRLPARSRQ
jgi:hypothetical protein